MKGSNVVVVVALAIICVLGWGSFAMDIISTNREFKAHVSEGNDFVEQGLYQRAIESYEEALEVKDSEDVYEKINYAYDLRLDEDLEGTYEDYYEFLEEAVKACPGNEVLIDTYMVFCQEQEDYLELYNCLLEAKDHGYREKDIDELIQKTKYAYDFKGGVRANIKQSAWEYYAIANEERWGIYLPAEGTIITAEYKMIGICNEDGTAVYTSDTDSRLIDIDGVVLGILEDKVTDAGVFSEGLVPAYCKGEYNYYDEYGKKVFGGFENAGMFQDGRAAVQKDGKWMLIDEDGEIVSDEYEEIVLDYVGRYIVDDVIIISEKEGVYAFCDEDLDIKEEIKCDDIDGYSEDGLIAFCKDGKWGFIDDDAEEVIKPQYENAKSFSNGLAAVCKDGKWGFIDSEGRLVIEYQFSDVGYFVEDGTCVVRKDFYSEQSEDESENSEVYYQEWQLIRLELGIMED